MPSPSKAFWRLVDHGALSDLLARFPNEVLSAPLDSAGYSMLHRAARHNQLELAAYLLTTATNVDVNAVDEHENKTALYEACCEGHLEMARALLARGADATISKFNDWTPLHIAACKGLTQIVHELGGTGGLLDARNKDGALALHLACREGHSDTVRELVRLGSAVNVRNLNGRTPLMCACASGSVSTLVALTSTSSDGGVSFDDAAVIDKSGFTPLHEASTADAVEWLLLQSDTTTGARRWLAYRDVYGSLPIHVAASTPHRSCVLRAMLLLRSTEADDLVNAEDGNGCTALLLACGKGHAAAVQQLLYFGADERVADKHGRTALQVASQWHRHQVVSVLQRRAIVLLPPTSNQEEEAAPTLMPSLGLGTFRLEEHTYAAVREALRIGYRSIDCAEFYGNEAAVGQALADSGVPRGDVFLTSKVWNASVSAGTAVDALRGILQRLRVDTLDLVLVHWPCRGYERAFQQLSAHPELANRVGVSNFLPEHVERIKLATGAYPVLNQIEFSAYFARLSQVEYFQHRGIAVQAYRSLGREGFVGKQIKLQESSAAPSSRVLLRWCLQHNVGVIPKSSQPDRLAANAQLFDFELGEEEMAELDSIGACESSSSAAQVEAQWMETVFSAGVKRDVW